MRLIPAIDVREGACVQLVGGEYADERIRLPDPVAVARDWRARGFEWLHLVDLDAATERGENRAVLGRILRDVPGPAQVAGGIRTAGQVGYWLAAGAAGVVIGSRAFGDPAAFARMAHEFPGRIVAACDVRGDCIVAGGWQREVEETINAALARLSTLPLAGVLVTAVHREGRMQGADLALAERVVRSSRHPVIISGGISSHADLQALAQAGAAAVVLGMALYTGKLSTSPAGGAKQS